MARPLKTIVYTIDSPVTLSVAGRLVQTGRVSAVVLQAPMDAGAKLRFLRRRLRRAGLLRFVDETVFHLGYRLFMRRADDRLRRWLELDRTATRAWLAARTDVIDVESLNTAGGRDLLRRLQPDLVIMMSREMIQPDVLALARLGFVGCHPGIIPDYRGAYSSFWAMRDGRFDKVGLSIYKADAGVDTGPLVTERVVPPRFGIRHFKVESERLLLEGAVDLVETIEKAGRGALSTYTKPSAISGMYSHVGATHYVSALTRSAGRRVTVLLYHRVAPFEEWARLGALDREYVLTDRRFEEHLACLAARRIPVCGLDDCLAADRVPDRERAPVVLTFDDGDRSCHTIVAPLLERYGFRGEFFVVSGWIGQAGSLTADQARDLVRRGHRIHAHSRTHPDLRALDPAGVEREVAGSMAEIAGVTGVPRMYFSAPDGLYDDRTVGEVRRAGYAGILVSTEGYGPAASDAFVWRRFTARSHTTVKDLAAICERPLYTQARLAVKRRTLSAARRALGTSGYMRIRGAVVALTMRLRADRHARAADAGR